MVISGLMGSGESRYCGLPIIQAQANISRPSTAVTCSSGEELRKTIYAEVVSVLQESGMLYQGP